MSSENSKSLLRAEHISKAYGEKQVLKDISIHLEQGELVFFPVLSLQMREKSTCVTRM